MNSCVLYSFGWNFYTNEGNSRNPNKEIQFMQYNFPICKVYYEYSKSQLEENRSAVKIYLKTFSGSAYSFFYIEFM